MKSGLLLLLLATLSVSAQRRMVVVNMETKVPVRDVQVFTDEGKNMTTRWDGTFELPDSFSRIHFRHPQYEQRYILRSELRSDTVWLLPNTNAIGEVVIYGHRRFNDRMAQMLKPSPQQIERDKLPQAIPSGPNVLALASWLFDITFGKKLAERSRRKKALKEVHQKEMEAQQKWDMLRDTQKHGTP